MVAKKSCNKLNTTIFDRHDLQNCKAIVFRKLAIKPNENKLMFPVIFIFSNWILIEQIIASSNPSVLEETDLQKILPEVLSGGLEAWVKKHRFNYFLGTWTPQIEKRFPHMLEYTSKRKFNKYSGKIKL